MKKYMILLVGMLLFVQMQAQPHGGRDDRYSPANMERLYEKREVDIPMRDGVRLRTEIYEPRDRSVQHPVIMMRTCYGVAPYGAEYADLRSEAAYVDAGYIIVYQDVRGQNMSEGEFEHIRPFIEGKKLSRKAAKNVGQTDEASDTYDTVEWLVANTNNNGCVGQKGVSYPGFFATMGALSGHPAMKAVSPQAPVSDWFQGDDIHHNGAFMLAESASFIPWFEKATPNTFVKSGGDRRSLRMPDLGGADVYTDFLRIGTYSNLMAEYADSIGFLRLMREHPHWDDYWESHTVTKGHLHDVQPAVMIVGGFFDKEDCYGAFDTYRSIRHQSPSTELYLVAGPWYHGAWSRGMTATWRDMYFGEEASSEYYIRNIEYPFFAYYLEGKGEKPQPGALVYDSGTREWHRYPEGWPAKGAAATPFYLAADGSVSASCPEAGVVSYVSDPAHPVPFSASVSARVSKDYMIEDQRFASRRPDVVSFVTEPLESPLSLAGEVKVKLRVAISSTDADFVVKVIDVFPDHFSWRDEVGAAPTDINMAGYQLMVRGEVMRGKYRENFSYPVPFAPGEVTEVNFSMPDVSHTFKPGHRLMIQVQSSWFPLVDRNPQTFCDIYTCDGSAYVPAAISICCGGDNASAVYLPVVE